MLIWCDRQTELNIATVRLVVRRMRRRHKRFMEESRLLWYFIVNYYLNTVYTKLTTIQRHRFTCANRHTNYKIRVQKFPC